MSINSISEAPKLPDAVWVCEVLDDVYGALSWRSHGEPLDVLIQTILSQATSDINSGRAYDSLRRRFPQGWSAVRTAALGDLADAIRCGGLADAKAPRIKAALESNFSRTGCDDLEFLKTMPTAEAKAFLESFEGVGPKTAACVLMFSLGRPVLPVDTHVFRVSHRLGLVNPKSGEARAHDLLQRQLPDERVYAYHVHLIRHGRRVCSARAPECGGCALAGRCPSAPLLALGGRRPDKNNEKMIKKDGLNSLHGLKEFDAAGSK